MSWKHESASYAKPIPIY